MIEWDVDFSDTQRRYVVLVDLGDETVVLTREMLADMLNSLDMAEVSASSRLFSISASISRVSTTVSSPKSTSTM